MCSLIKYHITFHTYSTSTETSYFTNLNYFSHPILESSVFVVEFADVRVGEYNTKKS